MGPTPEIPHTQSTLPTHIDRRYLVTADHVLASHFRVTASRPGLAPEAAEEEFRARVLCRAGGYVFIYVHVDVGVVGGLCSDFEWVWALTFIYMG